MFQRLLVFALLALIGILVVRSISRWLQRGGWIGGGQDEISARWEVVKPLGKLGRAAEGIIRNKLMLDSDAAVKRVGQIFDVAHRALQDVPSDPTEVRALAGDATQSIGSELYRDDVLNAEGWLRYAVDLVQDAHPDMHGYEVKRITISTYRQVFDSDTEAMLSPEPCLSIVSESRLSPVVEDDYAHLGKLGSDYSDDPAFQTLVAMPAELLPDGAILPILRLMYKLEYELEQEADDAIFTLLNGYGERLYGTVIACITGKVRFVVDLSIAYSPTLFRLIGNWPRTSAESIFRVALESGWNDCVRFLPAEGWAIDLAARFEDSPYKRPS